MHKAYSLRKSPQTSRKSRGKFRWHQTIHVPWQNRYYNKTKGQIQISSPSRSSIKQQGWFRFANWRGIRKKIIERFKKKIKKKSKGKKSKDHKENKTK